MKLSDRISTAWQCLTGKYPEPPPSTGDEEILTLKRETASLRLELNEIRESLESERARAAAFEKAQDSNIKANVESQLDEVFTRLAAPMSQLLMQSSLLEAGTPVGVGDVMALARNLIDGIEQAGLERIGSAGEKILFDSETAQPLSSGSEIQKGGQVVVKFPGYRYCNRVIRKAFVEKKD